MRSSGAGSWSTTKVSSSAAKLLLRSSDNMPPTVSVSMPRMTFGLCLEERAIMGGATRVEAINVEKRMALAGWTCKIVIFACRCCLAAR